MAEFRMPSLGAGMDAGTLLEWYVDPGSEVHRGDIVALVETDKAAIEVEVFEEGVVTDLVVPEGTKVPVGTVLAHLEASPSDTEGDAGDDVAPDASAQAAGSGAAPAARPEAPADRPPDASAQAAADTAPTASPAAEEPLHHAVVQSPLVRRLAARHGIQLDDVHGTGPHGSITRDDVERAAHDRPEVTDPSTEPAADTGAGRPTGAGAGRRRATSPESGPPVAPASGRQRSSPYARRLAAATGVDLDGLRGSGPNGAVVAHDIGRPSSGGDGAVTPHDGPARPGPAPTAPSGAESTPAEPATPSPSTPASRRPPSASAGSGNEAMRRAIARSMAQSNRDIPHYHLRHSVDVEQTLRWLDARNADRPPAERVLPAVLVLKATAMACRDHPALNGYWVDDAFQQSADVHVGVAISLRGGGLVAPAIHDTDSRSLDEVMAALVDLVRRARAGRLRGSELTGPTITVTNLGDRGVEVVHGLVHPPQVALVGAGRITPRPWAVDDMVGVRRVLDLSLAADHRASDGHLGGLFLAAIARHLQEPEQL